MSEEIWGSAAKEGKEERAAQPPPGILKEARSTFRISKVEEIESQFEMGCSALKIPSFTREFSQITSFESVSDKKQNLGPQSTFIPTYLGE